MKHLFGMVVNKSCEVVRVLTRAQTSDEDRARAAIDADLGAADSNAACQIRVRYRPLLTETTSSGRNLAQMS
jgi:hypothetical protein